MKSNTITLRVSDELKNQLENLGFEQEKSTSEITRSIIEDYFYTSEDFESTKTYLTNLNRKEDNIDLLQTLEFSELIFWIYEKYRDPNMQETDEFYQQIINTIDKLNNHPLFNDEILNELEKISQELKMYFKDPSSSEWWLNFPSQGHLYSFNYELFKDFFFCIRCEEDIEDVTI